MAKTIEENLKRQIQISHNYRDVIVGKEDTKEGSFHDTRFNFYVKSIVQKNYKHEIVCELTTKELLNSLDWSTLTLKLSNNTLIDGSMFHQENYSIEDKDGEPIGIGVKLTKNIELDDPIYNFLIVAEFEIAYDEKEKLEYTSGVLNSDVIGTQIHQWPESQDTDSFAIILGNKTSTPYKELITTLPEDIMIDGIWFEVVEAIFPTPEKGFVYYTELDEVIQKPELPFTTTMSWKENPYALDPRGYIDLTINENFEVYASYRTEPEVENKGSASIEFYLKIYYKKVKYKPVLKTPKLIIVATETVTEQLNPEPLHTAIDSSIKREHNPEFDSLELPFVNYSSSTAINIKDTSSPVTLTAESTYDTLTCSFKSSSIQNILKWRVGIKYNFECTTSPTINLTAETYKYFYTEWNPDVSEGCASELELVLTEVTGSTNQYSLTIPIIFYLLIHVEDETNGMLAWTPETPIFEWSKISESTITFKDIKITIEDLVLEFIEIPSAIDKKISFDDWDEVKDLNYYIEDESGLVYTDITYWIDKNEVTWKAYFYGALDEYVIDWEVKGLKYADDKQVQFTYQDNKLVSNGSWQVQKVICNTLKGGFK